MIIYSGSLFGQKTIKVRNFSEKLPKIQLDEKTPQKYLMVVRTNMIYGGVYDIYVNDELVKTFDYFDFIRFGQIIRSVTGKRYFPEGVYNKFDMWVDNIPEYGRAKIRFEYKSPGFITDNGFIIDYIEFIPANQLQ